MRIPLILAALLIFVPANPVFCDVIRLKDGGEDIIGKVLQEDENYMILKLKGTGTCKVPKSLIRDIKREEIPEDELYTKTDEYYEKLKKVDPKSAESQVGIAEWCAENGADDNNLTEMAVWHYKKALELDPATAKRAGKRFLGAIDKEAGKQYDIADIAYKNEEYMKAEHYLLLVMAAYPGTETFDKARDLLIKIWGRTGFDKLMAERDNLPDVVLSPIDVEWIRPLISTPELREAYYLKCFNKGADYEKRAKEVYRDKKDGYYYYAIKCYIVASGAGTPKVADTSKEKIKRLSRDFLAARPLPANDMKYTFIVECLKNARDRDFVKKTGGDYFKEGMEIYKKAKKEKLPKKVEDAIAAYFCFSIANEFSGNEKVKHRAVDYMAECETLKNATK